MKETEKAYAAGYIDGDGYIGITYVKSKQFFDRSISINSCDLENIEWIASKFKGNIRRQPLSHKRRRDSFIFNFAHESFDDFYKIIPYLTEKKVQANLFKQFSYSIPFADKERLYRLIKENKSDADLFSNSHKEFLETIRNTIVPVDTDFAWLAGFIDSECSIDISKRVKEDKITYRPQLQLNNTKSPAFYFVSPRFGGCFHFLNKKGKGLNQMLWRLSERQLIPVLKGTIPFLIHKKEIAKEIIKFMEVKDEGKKIGRNHPFFKDAFNSYLSQQSDIYHKVKLLNNRQSSQ